MNSSPVPKMTLMVVTYIWMLLGYIWVPISAPSQHLQNRQNMGVAAIKNVSHVERKTCPGLYAVKMMKCKSNLAVLVWELGNLPFAEAMSWLGPFEDPLVNVWLPHFINYDFCKLFLVHTSGFHTFQAAFQMFGITEPKICIPEDNQETTIH